MTQCARDLVPEEGRLYFVEVFVTRRFVAKVRAKNENIAKTLARNKVSIHGTEGLKEDTSYLSVSAGDADSKEF